MKFVKKNSKNIDSQILRKCKTEIIDIDPDFNGEKINIFFQNSSGVKVNVLTPVNSTIGDLLDNYVIKIGLGKDVVDTGIYFLFSGAKLRKNDRMNIIEKGITNGSIIMVIDRNAVLGA